MIYFEPGTIQSIYTVYIDRVYTLYTRYHCVHVWNCSPGQNVPDSAVFKESMSTNEVCVWLSDKGMEKEDCEKFKG